MLGPRGLGKATRGSSSGTWGADSDVTTFAPGAVASVGPTAAQPTTCRADSTCRHQNAEPVSVKPCDGCAWAPGKPDQLPLYTVGLRLWYNARRSQALSCSLQPAAPVAPALCHVAERSAQAPGHRGPYRLLIIRTIHHTSAQRTMPSRSDPAALRNRPWPGPSAALIVPRIHYAVNGRCIVDDSASRYLSDPHFGKFC